MVRLSTERNKLGELIVITVLHCLPVDQQGNSEPYMHRHTCTVLRTGSHRRIEQTQEGRTCTRRFAMHVCAMIKEAMA
jgi:translation elongation factor EF-Ts